MFPKSLSELGAGLKTYTQAYADSKWEKIDRFFRVFRIEERNPRSVSCPEKEASFRLLVPVADSCVDGRIPICLFPMIARNTGIENKIPALKCEKACPILKVVS